MPRHRLVALAALALLAACGDPAPNVPTAPSAPPSLTLAPGPACTRGDYDALQAAIDLVYAPSVQNDAKQRLGRVRTRCPGKDAVLDLVEQTIVWRTSDPTLVPAGDAAVWAFFTGLFDYIGYGLDNGAGALGAQGFIGVCTNGIGCEVKAPAHTSGVKLFPGALGGAATNRYLVTGAPTPCSGIDQYTDLQIFGQCIEVSVDPKNGSSFVLSPSPGNPAPAIVQTCLSDEAYALAKYLTIGSLYLGDATTTRPRLAQRSGLQTSVKLRPRPASTFFTGACDDATDVALGPRRAPQGMERLLASPTMLALGRAAEWLLLPRAAHAGHGGLGSLPGLVEEFSKFGPADPLAFQATFDNPYPSTDVPNVVRTADVIGQPPVDDDLGRATWTYDAEPPGYVQVVGPGFGGLTTGNAVAINQAGGASAGKRGVTLLANLAHFTQATEESGTLANAGKYRIRWTSVVTTPRIGGEGRFVVRAVRATTAGEDTVEIARFAYTNGKNAQSGPITFTGETNGTVTTSLTWQQNVRQRFEILVDLGATTTTGGTAYLGILNPIASDQSTIVATRKFTAGARLVQAGWALRGQDNQILGMDSFEIVRLPDTYVVP